MKNLYYLSALLLGISVNAKILPDTNIPDDFNNSEYIIKTINPNSYNTVESSGCNEIKYKDFFYYTDMSSGEKIIDYFPKHNLSCLFSGSVYDIGYNIGLPEQVVYSESNSLWVKKKSRKADMSFSFNTAPYKQIKLYNIISGGLRGYAVVNYNITDYDREVYKNKEIKKIISFCLINGQDALCGSGDAGVNINGKNIDLTPYILKSLESVEMGIANPLFINKE